MAGSTAARTARRSGTATPARPAGSGRWRSATRRCSAPVLGHLTSAVVAARRVRAVGRRRRGSGGRAGAPGGLPARPVPGPRVLGPAVRGLLALPADLAGPAVAGGRLAGRWSGAAMHRPSRLPEHPPSGSLGPEVTPLCRARGRSRAISPTMRRPSPSATPAEPTCDRRPSPERRALHPTPGPRPDPRPGQAGTRRPRPPRRDEGVPERQARPARRRPGHPRGRLRVPRRPVRRRQVDAHQAAHPRRAGDPRRGRPRRPGRRPARASPGAEDAAQDRDHLPGLQAAAVEDGLGERGLRARGHRHAAQADPAGGRPRARPRRPDRPGASRRHRSCRAGSSSGRRSPARSSTTRA